MISDSNSHRGKMLPWHSQCGSDAGGIRDTGAIDFGHFRIRIRCFEKRIHPNTGKRSIDELGAGFQTAGALSGIILSKCYNIARNRGSPADLGFRAGAAEQRVIQVPRTVHGPRESDVLAARILTDAVNDVSANGNRVVSS